MYYLYACSTKYVNLTLPDAEINHCKVSTSTNIVSTSAICDQGKSVLLNLFANTKHCVML